jgi:hypothetical protein
MPKELTGCCCKNRLWVSRSDVFSKIQNHHFPNFPTLQCLHLPTLSHCLSAPSRRACPGSLSGCARALQCRGFRGGWWMWWWVQGIPWILWIHWWSMTLNDVIVHLESGELLMFLRRPKTKQVQYSNSNTVSIHWFGIVWSFFVWAKLIPSLGRLSRSSCPPAEHWRWERRTF